MTTMHKHYALGGRSKFTKLTAAIAWSKPSSNPLIGIAAYARDERTGEYVRVYEVMPEEFVQGEPQSWSQGAFEDVETAKHCAWMAYRYINKGAR
jgi:hypothetical protein